MAHGYGDCVAKKLLELGCLEIRKQISSIPPPLDETLPSKLITFPKEGKKEE